ncbi:MAG TPA: hypothetical protein VMR70_18000 [Flavisolibacter sp.]|nr:hypothetical protein [Flavisolibacter sp.]
MKFGALIFVLFLFSCVSEGTDNKETQKNVFQTPETSKFHPTYTSELEDTIRTLDLSYLSFACQCANWVKANEHEDYQKKVAFVDRPIFVEPADSTLNLSDTIGYSGDVIRFTGQFYKNKGYPKNYPVTEMNPDKARVFRYTRFKILSSGYVNFKKS